MTVPRTRPISPCRDVQDRPRRRHPPQQGHSQPRPTGTADTATTSRTIVSGCTADYCPTVVTAPDVIIIYASPFYPAMNGAFQAARQAANGIPKTSPNLVPGNKPPPQWPEDFWDKWWAAYFEALTNVLTDFILVPDPCLTNPNVPCGGQGPPRL
jgi:hypothetical protein